MALSSMNKADMQRELTRAGFNFEDPALRTNIMMAEAIRGLRPSASTPDDLKGLGKKHVVELRDICRRYQLDPTGKTGAQMRLALQGWGAPQTRPPVPSSVHKFGTRGPTLRTAPLSPMSVSGVSSAMPSPLAARRTPGSCTLEAEHDRLQALESDLLQRQADFQSQTAIAQQSYATAMGSSHRIRPT